MVRWAPLPSGEGGSGYSITLPPALRAALGELGGDGLTVLQRISRLIVEPRRSQGSSTRQPPRAAALESAPQTRRLVGVEAGLRLEDQRR
jgi:hypothetical protein